MANRTFSTNFPAPRQTWTASLEWHSLTSRVSGTGSLSKLKRNPLMNWKQLMSVWTPRYDYEFAYFPHVAAIRAANLTQATLDRVARVYGDRNWNHDSVQNVMTLPACALEADKETRAKREARRAAQKGLRIWPGASWQSKRIHCVINARKPGEFLERQRKIDYALLLSAHRMPGVSMSDNLERFANPSAMRLANA